MNFSKQFIGAVAGAAVSSSALAITFGAPGDYRFNFSGVDSASVGYDTTGPNIICTDVASCDAAVALPAPAAIGSEDTWGVARIDSVTLGGNPVHTDGDNGEFLTAMFYGLNDQQVEHVTLGGNTIVGTFSTGGFIDIYVDNTDDGVYGVPGDRTGLAAYPGFTEGELLLRLAFGIDTGVTPAGTTLSGNYNANTIGGGSVAFLDVIGGTAAAIFDTNSSPDGGGAAHDFALNVSFQCATAQINNGDCDPANGGAAFSVLINGSFIGNAQIPLPGSAVLLVAGITLLGWRKRQQRKAAE